MLAELARRRSLWLRSSLATTRWQSSPAPSRATRARVRDEEKDEEEGHVAVRTKPLVDGGRSLRPDEPSSLNFHLQLQLKEIKSQDCEEKRRRVVQDQKGQSTRVEEQVKLQAEAEAGEFLSLVATRGRPAKKDVDNARASLQNLARGLADPRAAVARETGFQRARRQLKAATGKLDRMLYAMRKRRDFAQVEAVAFVYEEELPQFAGQRKHWCVICEHYALALNYEQRFQDVVDKFSSCYRSRNDCEGSAKDVHLLTPRLAQSIFVALGHLREAGQALQLLGTMERHGVNVTKVSYFHVLNALLHDERFTDFEKVMQICEDIGAKLPGETVPLSLLPMIMMTAAACGESKRAMKFYSHPPDRPMSIFTEFRFEICLQQLHHLGEDAMLMEMYRNLMVSSQASHDLKVRVSKYLLRKRVALATADTRNECLDIACEILKMMNQHKIPASHHAIYPLLRALLIDPVPLSGDESSSNEQQGEHVQFQVKCAKDLRDFFTRYSQSLEWNAFVLCEAIVAGVRADRADIVDDLFVYALDSGMSIKYAALEQVVVYYYRLGLIGDLKRVSDMVRALRLNKDIPLGIAVTEVGMAANLRLGCYEEVVMLFEDFSALDGEHRRVLQRRFMLKTVLEAYKHLGRGDEAMAIQALLYQMHGTLLDSSKGVDNGAADEEMRVAEDSESADDETELMHDSSRDLVVEQERLSLRRFNR
uniref:Pentatricopeptide repeat-containing protein n=1 Tax=Peronospora matthiolae TaxID=2874970 RepID=A0AAV1TDP5_9STRA